MNSVTTSGQYSSVAGTLARPVVLFDLDGTLADTVGLIVASFQHTVGTALGWTPTEEHCKQWIGRSLRATFVELDAARADELTEAYLAWNLAHHDAWVRGFDGVAELLAGLTQAGRRTGVVTSKRRASAAVTMARAGLNGRVPVLAVEEDTTEHKPAPAPLLLAVERLAVAPSDAVYVGDAVVDVQAARAAGMACIAVTWGATSRTALEAAGPSAVVDDVADLAVLLGV